MNKKYRLLKSIQFIDYQFITILAYKLEVKLSNSVSRKAKE